MGKYDCRWDGFVKGLVDAVREGIRRVRCQHQITNSQSQVVCHLGPPSSSCPFLEAILSFITFPVASPLIFTSLACKPLATR